MRKNTLVFILLVVASTAFVVRGPVRNWYIEWSKPAVPSPIPYRPTPTPIAATASPVPSALPDSVNLDVVFVSQAPQGVWDHDHEEFCEEASSVMAASYVRGDDSAGNPITADMALQAAKTYELQTFGYFEDTTAQETARMLREHFKVSAVSVVYDPTVAQIKSWLAHRRLVLMPASGRDLGNPYFTQPGPLYHLIVIKGYTADDRFITNDPGTRHGANYIYDESVIMNAMHDFNGGDVTHGRKVVIVVG